MFTSPENLKWYQRLKFSSKRSENSEFLLDHHTAIHVSFGIILYFFNTLIGTYAFGSIPGFWENIIAVFLEATWFELVENMFVAIPYLEESFAAKLAGDYEYKGDHLVNSISDIFFGNVTGGVLAHIFGVELISKCIFVDRKTSLSSHLLGIFIVFLIWETISFFVFGGNVTYQLYNIIANVRAGFIAGFGLIPEIDDIS